MQRLLFLLCLLTLSVEPLSPNNCQAETGVQGPNNRPQIFAKIVQEPVFNSRAYILESGRQNQKSVVLIHGLGDLGADTWKALLPQLAHRYHVITFDLPGFGLSEKKNALYSPVNYAKFVKWVVDNYAKGTPDIIGHSMGGTIAIAYAGTYPDRLNTLILADVAGVLHKAAFTKEMLQPRLGEQWESVPFGALDWIDSLVEKSIMKLEALPIETDMPLENPYFRDSILGADPTKIAALATIQSNLGPLLPRITVPTLLLWGSEDQVTPFRTAILLNGVLKNSRLTLIPKAGHVPMLENPSPFNEAVFDFLALTGHPPLPEIIPGTKSATCRNQSNATFEGSYKTLSISNCVNVRLSNLSAESIEISESSVAIENVSIIGQGTGLKARNSRITATALKIDAEDALIATNSTLDLAGTTLRGRSSALSTPNKAEFLFSASRVQSSKSNKFLHGRFSLTPQTSY